MSEVIVKLKHARSLSYCSRGMRQFFARHGLDWDTFRKQGLPESQLLGTNDYMAQQVVEEARKDL